MPTLIPTPSFSDSGTCFVHSDKALNFWMLKDTAYLVLSMFSCFSVSWHLGTQFFWSIICYAGFVKTSALKVKCRFQSAHSNQSPLDHRNTMTTSTFYFIFKKILEVKVPHITKSWIWTSKKGDVWHKIKLWFNMQSVETTMTLQ